MIVEYRMFSELKSHSLKYKTLLFFLHQLNGTMFGTNDIRISSYCFIDSEVLKCEFFFHLGQRSRYSVPGFDWRTRGWVCLKFHSTTPGPFVIFHVYKLHREIKHTNVLRLSLSWTETLRYFSVEWKFKKKKYTGNINSLFIAPLLSAFILLAKATVFVNEQYYMLII